MKWQQKSGNAISIVCDALCTILVLDMMAAHGDQLAIVNSGCLPMM